MTGPTTARRFIWFFVWVYYTGWNQSSCACSIRIGIEGLGIGHELCCKWRIWPAVVTDWVTDKCIVPLLPCWEWQDWRERRSIFQLFLNYGDNADVDGGLATWLKWPRMWIRRQDRQGSNPMNGSNCNTSSSWRIGLQGWDFKGNSFVRAIMSRYYFLSSLLISGKGRPRQVDVFHMLPNQKLHSQLNLRSKRYEWHFVSECSQEKKQVDLCTIQSSVSWTSKIRDRYNRSMDRWTAVRQV